MLNLRFWALESFLGAGLLIAVNTASAPLTFMIGNVESAAKLVATPAMHAAVVIGRLCRR